MRFRSSSCVDGSSTELVQFTSTFLFSCTFHFRKTPMVDRVCVLSMQKLLWLQISEVRGQWTRSNSRKLLAHISTTSIYVLSVRDFEPKGTKRSQKEPFRRSEFTLVLSLDIPDAGRSPNPVRGHARLGLST